MADTHAAHMELSEAEQILMNIMKQTDESCDEVTDEEMFLYAAPHLRVGGTEPNEVRERDRLKGNMETAHDGESNLIKSLSVLNRAKKKLLFVHVDPPVMRLIELFAIELIQRPTVHQSLSDQP
ncbi:uncharacterized protein LOC125274083 isoform X2 [Megalobrama amblycephala]|uniref:uncharacterized protein LOC125274083 isoform X2 n=1 Tax=Megalobrama amblycephala TaxID=75352 RepID=UPI00201424A0|nr:uncharacterized protein LOC125274083 isoform X2 [Megalobrama amblycephala]